MADKLTPSVFTLPAAPFDLADVKTAPEVTVFSHPEQLRLVLRSFADHKVEAHLNPNFEDVHQPMNCPVQSSGRDEARVCLGPKGIKGKIRF